MPIYEINITKKAKKNLDKIPLNKAKPIFDAISKLGVNPRPKGFKNYLEEKGIESELEITGLFTKYLINN